MFIKDESEVASRVGGVKRRCVRLVRRVIGRHATLSNWERKLPPCNINGLPYYRATIIIAYSIGMLIGALLLDSVVSLKVETDTSCCADF